jgi:hypothetical protein
MPEAANPVFAPEYGVASARGMAATVCPSSPRIFYDAEALCVRAFLTVRRVSKTPPAALPSGYSSLTD